MALIQAVNSDVKDDRLSGFEPSSIDDACLIDVERHSLQLHWTQHACIHVCVTM